ncbi:MAG: transcriptional regulator [Candidatus Muproteobacteria bacterium RBG_16_62_13]|uniref:Transcriptional regulator n=1 Tax=Candidatus Muproteobacteria bacterium RBG_16_62_13 TaxID=1817756 RepID=A0A1F6T829_9PROT|nr:MAG: transcriptional regulator [Candidatus Muproteobacteria bacterium RBG_16_62_13]
MPLQNGLPHSDLVTFKVACKDCSLYQLCLPVGMGEKDLELLERIVNRRRPLERGEYLFRIGDPFRCFYTVRSGTVKSSVLMADGREQVTGFHLPGEIVGLDALASGRHDCAARALEVTSVCEVPYDHFEKLWETVPNLPRQMMRIMSNELAQERVQLVQLGQKTGAERLAAFLLSLSARLHRRGLSESEFHLSMSRTDIGTYLGLAEETVSRLFTMLQELGVLTVSRRHVCIQDFERLRLFAHPISGHSEFF